MLRMKTRTPVKDRFQGKVAIVTGGSSGIGRAVVEELCKEGCSVAFTGISDIGFTTARELTQAGYDVLFCRATCCHACSFSTFPLCLPAASSRGDGRMPRIHIAAPAPPHPPIS
jgi:hypothetical protein